MLRLMNDIHRSYIQQEYGKLFLAMDAKYSYNFVNIDSSGFMLIGRKIYSPYFFVFATEKQEPFSVFINIVPAEYLHVIQITMHPDTHFHYLNMSDFTRNTNIVPINDYIDVQYDDVKRQFSAIIQNQKYSNIRPDVDNIVHADKVKYDLFIKDRTDAINSDDLYNKNFEIQKKFFDEKVRLEYDIKQSDSINDDLIYRKSVVLNYLDSALKSIVLTYPQPIPANEYDQIQNNGKNV